MEIPGIVVGIYRIVPSSRGGMNSEPSERKTGIVSMRSTTAVPKTTHLWRNVHETAGSYARIKVLLTGFDSSARIFPTSSRLRILHNQTGLKSSSPTLVIRRRRAGSRVIAKTAATATAKVLV